MELQHIWNFVILLFIYLYIIVICRRPENKHWLLTVLEPRFRIEHFQVNGVFTVKIHALDLK